MIDYQQAVKDLRDKLILTQAELAEFLGASFASINRWENGAHTPTFEYKRKIAALCKENNIVIKEKAD